MTAFPMPSRPSEGDRYRQLGAMVLRRFCGCPIAGGCVCGLPRPTTRWTVDRLDRLWALMKEHGSVHVAAQLLDETVHECNVALDALLGRTAAHALAALEAKAARS